jgi:hypothetical protein
MEIAATGKPPAARPHKDLPRPLFSRERMPVAWRPVGEGSADPGAAVGR